VPSLRKSERACYSETVTAKGFMKTDGPGGLIALIFVTEPQAVESNISA
jgi:hypothetical protein